MSDYFDALISAGAGLFGAALGVWGSLKVAGRTEEAARRREAGNRLWGKATEVYERLLAEILQWQAGRRNTMRRAGFGDTPVGPGNGVDEVPLPEWIDEVFQYETAVRIYGHNDVLILVSKVKEAEAATYRLFLAWSVAVKVSPEFQAEATGGRTLDQAYQDAQDAAARADDQVAALEAKIKEVVAQPQYHHRRCRQV